MSSAHCVASSSSSISVSPSAVLFSVVTLCTSLSLPFELLDSACTFSTAFSTTSSSSSSSSSFSALAKPALQSVPIDASNAEGELGGLDDAGEVQWTAKVTRGESRVEQDDSKGRSSSPGVRTVAGKVIGSSSSSSLSGNTFGSMAALMRRGFSFKGSMLCSRSTVIAVAAAEAGTGADVEADVEVDAVEGSGSSVAVADNKTLFTLRLASLLCAMAARTSSYCTRILYT